LAGVASGAAAFPKTKKEKAAIPRRRGAAPPRDGDPNQRIDSMATLRRRGKGKVREQRRAVRPSYSSLFPYSKLWRGRKKKKRPLRARGGIGRSHGTLPKLHSSGRKRKGGKKRDCRGTLGSRQFYGYFCTTQREKRKRDFEACGES